MDYYKIFSLLFILFVIYKFNQYDNFYENFQSTSSSPDDWQAINQLAQISKQLMLGGVTVPGALTVNGLISTSGSNSISCLGGTITSGSYGGDSMNLTGTITGSIIKAGTRDVGSLLDSLQAQINTLSGTVSTLQSNTIKNDDTIQLRHTKGFNQNGSLAYTANGKGNTMHVGGWSGALGTDGQTENSYISQLRIQRNTN
jgi:hypothetical protein